MSITNLTDHELDAFLASPNKFLSQGENARRVLGLTPGTIAVIKEGLHRQGMTEAQINDRIGAVMSIKDIIKSIITTMKPAELSQIGRFQRNPQ